MNRIVIKIGSQILTRPDGTLDFTMISSIVDQVIAVRKAGYQVILVSSGAVACGRGIFRNSHRYPKLDAIRQRQLYSAVGQVRLIGLYSRLFNNWSTEIGQVLTMKESFSTRREYLTQRECMEVMLANDVVPIVNENDTTSVTELMFTDNDELSGLVASMMDADMLLILSNIDGIYNGSPKKAGTSVIRRITPDDDLSLYIQTEKSEFGRGGMLTKCSIARKVADEGIRVVIANGKKANIISDICLGNAEAVCTEFVPRSEAVSSVKKWIAHSSDFTKGSVIVDARAEQALKGRQAVSLLMVGVSAVEGDFEEGDIISICNSAGKAIAIGKSSYNASEARGLIGKHDCRPLVHYDYLYLV